MALHTDSNMLESPKNRCRICLEATNGKIELIQKIHYKETGILLRELLEFCVNEQVYENGKADGVCFDCMQKGTVYYGFQRLFKISQEVLLKEMEGNNGFSFEIKVEEDFEEESFTVESENIVLKPEILKEEEIEQVKKNPNECKMALQTDYNMLGNAKSRCRICLEATNGKIELNQTIHYKESGILLREMLEFCVNEQVYENGKADVLCLDCLGKGMVCNEFKRRFKVSQATLLKEMEENNGFSYAIKAEEDFKEESFKIKSENILIKDEILEEEELEQVKENSNNCELLTTTTETEKSTPTTTRSDKLISTLFGDKPTLIPHDDQPTISLGQKKGVEHKWEEKDEILQVEELGQVKENPNKCELLTTTTETEKSTPTITRSDKLTSITPPDDQPTISLEQKEHKPRNPCSYVQESSAALVQGMRNAIQQQILKNPDPLLQSAETKKPKTKKIKKCTCEYCGKSMNHDSKLMIHRRIHEEKPFSCKACGMNFSNCGDLAYHWRMHTGEKPYSCIECARSFKNSASLKKHQVVHTERKVDVCQQCAATFTRAGNLRRHGRSHEVVHSTERKSHIDAFTLFGPLHLLP